MSAGMAVAVAYPSWHPHVDVWLLVAAHRPHEEGRGLRMR